jgi:hypothetical protein
MDFHLLHTCCVAGEREQDFPSRFAASKPSFLFLQPISFSCERDFPAALPRPANRLFFFVTNQVG